MQTKDIWLFLDGGLLSRVTKDNIEGLEAKSVECRKEFCGVHIGELT